MGMLSKLAFWRRDKRTPVETFVDGDGAEASAESASSPSPCAQPEESPEVSVGSAALMPPPVRWQRLGPIGEDVPDTDRTASPASSRSPSPRMTENVSSAGLAFDVPVEQVWHEASQTLGQRVAESLQSPKWDRRVSALKAAAATLNGADLRGMAKPGSTGMLGKGLGTSERVRCWRSLCQVLHILMLDKVLPVRIAAHATFMDTFANSEGLVDEDEVRFALGVLLGHLIGQLGDSNPRLHDSARRCVLFAAEHHGLMGLNAVLERLREHLQAGASHDRSRLKALHFGVLDTVDFLLHHFPGHRPGGDEDDDEDEQEDCEAHPPDTWTQSEVSPFIVAGMSDSLGQRARASAVKLAVTVYGTFGSEAMQPVLAGLRPAKQQLLRRAFEESELDDADRAEAAGPSADGGENAGGRGERGEPATDRSPIAPRKDPRGTPNPALSRGSPKNAAAGARCGEILRPMAEKDEEELLMDHILEDAGLVFGGLDSCSPLHAKQPRPMPPGTLEALFGIGDPDEQRLLEQQLLELGISLDDDASCADRSRAAGGALPHHMNEGDGNFSLAPRRFRDGEILEVC